MLYIHNTTIYSPSDQINGGAVLVEGDRITKVGNVGEIHPPAGVQSLDGDGFILVPGFIDLQLNGGFGHDFTSDPESIHLVADEISRYGVTSFLPTIVTSPFEKIIAAQMALDRGKQSNSGGAIPLGLHIEGPFLNPEKKGAHKPEYLRLPDIDLIQDWTPERGIRLVTLAPELPGAIEIISYLVSRGVIVSAGHTMASFEQAKAGLDAGIRYATHIFNAMRTLNHREPGPVGTFLGDPDCIVGLIPDGIHIHPEIIRLIWKLKGGEGLNLITDAIAALGMSPGRYLIGDNQIVVSDTDSRLVDGTLAGSVLSMDQALRNLIEFTQCPLNQALATITTTPASLLGECDKRGRIAPGYQADLVLLTPDLKVALTIVAGNIVYQE
jgi:N-acetylglucosamine-6-phosphate deacetylase